MKSFSVWGRIVSMLGALAVVLSLGACLGDGSSGAASTTLSGTVAIGAPLTGATVTVIGANGVTVTTTTDATTGRYSVSGSFTYPAMLRATKTTTTLYSAATATGTANITTLTNTALIVNTALGNNLDTLFAAWAANAALLTQANMQTAQAIVNANLPPALWTSAGLTATTYDFLTTAFNANGVGIDALLDGLTFTFNYGAGTFTITPVGGAAITFNYSPNLTGYSFGGVTVTVGGSGSCTVPVCVTITGAVLTSGVTITVPPTTVSGLPTSAVPTANAVGDLQSSINTAYGALGTISNFQYSITSSTASQVVAHLTFSVTSTIPNVPSAAYDLTYTYDLVAAGSGSGGGGTLPAGVSGKLVNMTYHNAAVSGSPYTNNQVVLFTFSSSGTLTLTTNYTTVATTFTVIPNANSAFQSEYQWIDTTGTASGGAQYSGTKYTLALTNNAPAGEIFEVNINNAAGTFLGQFTTPVAYVSP